MLLLWAVLGCGPDNNFTQQTPHAAVFPSTLEFGEVPVEYSAVGYATVSNSGLVELTLTDPTFAGGDGVFTLLENPATVAPRSELEFPIQFLPTQYAPYASVLSFTTDDPENPTLDVNLTGTGVEAPTPDIELDRLSLDFGVVPVTGVPVIAYVRVENAGEGTLVFGDESQAGSGAFAVDRSIEGMSLAPGESTNLIVEYTPTTDAGDHGSFTLTSNDPDEASVTVTLLGNGGGDFEYPVAVITGPTSANPRDTITLDGTNSYDPGGSVPLTYRWSLLAAPSGAVIELNDPKNLDHTYLQVDLAGAYTVALQVTNSIGLMSVPAEHTISVLPGEAIHVELTWNTGSADFDLHLVKGDAPLFDNFGDCNYCNQNPDWGTPLVTTDNPTLVLDDISGYGPEEITIEDPVDDVYAVKAHYFTENGDGDVVATANVWIFGELKLTTSRVMSRNDVWDVGLITFPDGTVYEESVALYTAPTRTCE